MEKQEMLRRLREVQTFLVNDPTSSAAARTAIAAAIREMEYDGYSQPILGSSSLLCRPLHDIAAEIRVSWPTAPTVVQDYLNHMAIMVGLQHEDDEIIIRKFLKAAQFWRGPTAQRIKAELTELLKR